jgi:hypothetical protein
MLYLRKLNPDIFIDRHQHALLRGYDVPDSPARNDREHGIPQDLAEIGFLNGKGMEGLRGWFRAHYLAKIIGEMKRDRPYNACLPVGKVCEAELQNSPESLTGLTQFVICAIVLL